jgi:O-acetyl-ADP-ribose deacetylase (regulator of RNase III)
MPAALISGKHETIIFAFLMTKKCNIAPGHVAVTPAFNLSAKYIIHTVGPAWEDGNHGERDILHSC